MTAFNLTPLTSNCLLTLPCEPISDMPPSCIHPHSMDNSTLLPWPEALECHPHPPLSSQFSMQLGHTLKASFTYLPIPIPILITQGLDYCNDLKAHPPAPLFPI